MSARTLCGWVASLGWVGRLPGAGLEDLEDFAPDCLPKLLLNGTPSQRT